MKRSRFYCENCAAEVSARAKVCPSCGRFFSAVRCPRCGFTEEARLFLYGCPSCGYAANGPDTAHGGSGAWEIVGDVDEPVPRRKRFYQPREIPGWAWYFAAGLLTLIFVLLVILYINL